MAHSRLLLEDNADTAVIQADLRDPDAILTAPETQLLIDFSQPAWGCCWYRSCISSTTTTIPGASSAHLRDALAPGSYLVLSHGTGEAKPDVAAAASTVYLNKVAARGAYRSRTDILRFFDGFTLVDPGPPPHRVAAGRTRRDGLRPGQLLAAGRVGRRDDPPATERAAHQNVAIFLSYPSSARTAVSLEGHAPVLLAGCDPPPSADATRPCAHAHPAGSLGRWERTVAVYRARQTGVRQRYGHGSAVARDGRPGGGAGPASSDRPQQDVQRPDRRPDGPAAEGGSQHPADAHRVGDDVLDTWTPGTASRSGVAVNRPGRDLAPPVLVGRGSLIAAGNG